MLQLLGGTMIEPYELLAGVVLMLFLPFVAAFFTYLPKFSQVKKGLEVISSANIATSRGLNESFKSKDFVPFEVFLTYSTLTALSILSFSFLFRIYTNQLANADLEYFYTFTMIYGFVGIMLFKITKCFNEQRVNLAAELHDLSLVYTSLLLIFTGVSLTSPEGKTVLSEFFLFILFQVTLYFFFYRNVQNKNHSNQFYFKVFSCTRMSLNASFMTMHLLKLNALLKSELFILVLLLSLIIEIFLNIINFETILIKSRLINEKLDKLIVCVLAVTVSLKALNV